MPTRSVTSHSYKSPWPDKPEPGAVGAFGAWASGLTKSLQDAWVNTFGAEDGQGMTERVEVTVPSGVAAGEVFSVQVEGGGTFDVVVPSGVGTGDVVEVDVPMSLPPTSVEPSAEPTVPATPAVTEGSTEAPPSAMGSALPTTPGSRLPSQRGHEGGHELIKLPGRDSAPPTESPVGAFTGAWSHLPPAMPLMPPPLSKVGSHELAGCANYLGWRDEMVKLVDEGKKPPAALLTLLEASLHKLNDDDLREEYRWYAGQYMDDDASESLRNACEMIVIRIGEIVNMPQGARVDKRKQNKRLKEAAVTPRFNDTIEVEADALQAEASNNEYQELKKQMMELRRKGYQPPTEQYYELDLRLFLLSAHDQIEEYQRLAAIYLDDTVEVAVRGFCELRLTRLGEILYMSTAARISTVRINFPRLAALEQTKPHIVQTADARSRGEISVPMSSLPGAVEAEAEAAKERAEAEAKAAGLSKERAAIAAEMAAAQRAHAERAKEAAQTVPVQTPGQTGPAPGERAADVSSTPGKVVSSFMAGRAPPEHPAAPSTAHKPGQLPGWVTDDSAWAKDELQGGPSVKPGKLDKAGKSYTPTAGDVSKLSWFQRMRQREHLGGKKRDAQQMGIMTLQDELAREVAGLGHSISSKAPHREIVTEGTDSRPKVDYQPPAEYSQMQDLLVAELGSFLSSAAQEGGGPRSRLTKIAVQRPVPWQQSIIENPQAKLKKTGKIPQRALTGLTPPAAQAELQA